jgi:hypothetical protein
MQTCQRYAPVPAGAPDAAAAAAAAVAPGEDLLASDPSAGPPYKFSSADP